MNQVGKPVIGNDLIGREHELRLIKELLLAGQSVVLIAPRRMGKTSLMFELLRQLQDEDYFTTQGILRNKESALQFNDPLFKEWISKYIVD